MGHGELDYILNIALVLIFANLGGMLSRKLKQPVVLGQILAGVLIGPIVLNIVVPDIIISSFAEIGVILLMFLAGIETDLGDLKRTAGAASAIAFGGIITPFIMGFGAIYYFFPQEGVIGAAFVGVILTATSIGISVQVLRELKKIKEKTGISILGAAVIDDIIGIILLTVVLGVASPTGETGIVIVLLKMVGFFVLAGVSGRIFTSFMTKYSVKMLRNRNVGAFAIIVCFLLAYLAQGFGLAAIIGAYFSGIVFSMTPYNNRVEQDVSNIAYTLFTPIFFLNIGLSISVKNISLIIMPVVVLFLAAALSKVIGCSIGAKAMKYSFRESLQVGIGMMPRGEVVLITANIAKAGGFISDTIFTSLVVVVLITTIVTPSLLKKAYTPKIINAA
ncbi:MAG: cation:proton antiporter [Dethiosulfatibacter sp.]|nr:cation:proton antiporter [Dethiosulfatibacter sp.]